jgi:2-isopropylmalate synthase
MKQMKIKILETTLRDGEQIPGCKLELLTRIEIARLFEKLGVDVIEAGFPISSKSNFQYVGDISQTVYTPIICVLSRSMKKDIELAAKALEDAKQARIHLGVGTSNCHISYKFNNMQEKMIEQAVESVKYAKRFVEEVEFYSEDAGRTKNEFIALVFEAVIKVGATILNLPDSTGFCLPKVYGNKIRYIKENVKGIEKAIISTHCHNDLGLSTANSLEGVINGAQQIEGTFTGLGERAGNTALEEIVMIFNSHSSLGFCSNIKTEFLWTTSEFITKCTGITVQAHKPIVGSNAFSHSSGIHQMGLFNKRKNYEGIDIKNIGIKKSCIIITANSGLAALVYYSKTIGYVVSKESLYSLYCLFLKYSDKKNKIKDEDIKMILKIAKFSTAIYV